MRPRHFVIALLATAPTPLLAQPADGAKSCAPQNPFAGPAYKSVEVRPTSASRFACVRPKRKA
jgi:hypothetical protein